MVPTNVFCGVLTRVLLPIVGVYLLSLGLNVTQAHVEYVIDQPTLLGRTPPFLPGELLLSKREAKSEDDNDEKGVDKADSEKPETEEAASRGGLDEEGAKKNEDNEKPTKAGEADSEKGAKKDDTGDDDDSKSTQTGDEREKPKADDEKSSKELKEEEEASEGSRHLNLKHAPRGRAPFSFAGKRHKNKGPDGRLHFPPRPSSGPAPITTPTPSRTPQQTTQASLPLAGGSTVSPADSPTGSSIAPKTNPNQVETGKPAKAHPRPLVLPWFSTNRPAGKLATSTPPGGGSRTTVAPGESTKLPIGSPTPTLSGANKPDVSDTNRPTATTTTPGPQAATTPGSRSSTTTRPTSSLASSTFGPETSKPGSTTSQPSSTSAAPSTSGAPKTTKASVSSAVPSKQTSTTTNPSPKSSTQSPTAAASSTGKPVKTTTITPTTSPKMVSSIPASTAKPTIVQPQVSEANSTVHVMGKPHIPVLINTNTTRVEANPDAELLLGFNRTMFDVRDVAYFLESHPAHSVHDPRVYFTSERTTRSLVILSRELQRVPERLRFAYMVRVFNELGRKLASKLNYYAVELAAVLTKSPDELGNKPEVSVLVDAVNNAFESKDDGEIDDQAEIDLEFDNYITRIIESSSENVRVFRAAMGEISSRFAQLISYFVLKSTTPTDKDGQATIKLPPGVHAKLALLLGESLKSGAKTFILETAYDDRFRIPLDVIGYTNLILNDTISLMEKRLGSKDMKVADSIKHDFEQSMNVNSFKDLNPISDQIGLVGSWNSFLFANLGTTERLIKVFSSLLGRAPPEVKARWINMHIAQIHLELERTIPGFVVMQGMPFHGNASQDFLLNPEKTIELIPNKVPTIRDNYLADKNRIPARCYLAGRRWRLVLSRGLEKFADKDDVLDSFANRIGSIKNRMMDQSGNDIYRLCLPRLEVGIRGWTIDGNPEGADASQSTDKFPLKNPIEGLTEMENPFASGVSLGFGIGVRVGYNEERNATLEMERANHLQIGSNEFNSSLGWNEVNYVAMASYRRAATVGGRKAFEIAIREGYLASLKISVRAGMDIPVETGSRLSALKSVSFAGQAGQEAGKAAAEAFILERRLSDDLKRNLIKVGETHGLLAGEIAGEFIGSIVGKAAAEEAYRRSIIRGGKVARAKFHLEEFEAGAKLGFDYGVKEGKRIASSSTLDPSAPRFFRLPKPVFSDEDKPDSEVDQWEKELIPPLPDSVIENLASIRGHTPVRGSLRGTYKVAKEVKNGFKRISYSNVTYDLEVYAQGFIKDNIAYLTLNGTVNKMGILRGSLIARDIFNDDQDG